MSVLQFAAAALLFWFSGALFAAGCLSLRPSLLEAYDGRARSFPAPPTQLGGALVWLVIIGAVIWATVTLLQEVLGSELWTITRATYWAH